MKLTVEEQNWCATVVRIDQLHDLEGADRMKAVRHYGLQSLVSLDHKVGELGILVPAECQLSVDFCHNNNLFESKEMNRDKEAKGYIGKNCRVRRVRLRGHVSSGLWLPLSSLDYLKIPTEKLVEGDQFTHINDVQVVTKYVVRKRESGRGNKVRGQKKKWTRVDNSTFPEHFDTKHYDRCLEDIKPHEYITVTCKLHGTSARFAHVPVRCKLTWWEKVAKYFGARINETEYDVVAGSRRVIKDLKCDKVNDNYYDVDIWNQHLEDVKHLIPKDHIIYGEIIGWTKEGSAIQKNYTYSVPHGQSHFYVYRIAVVTETGDTIDYSWNDLVKFCEEFGLKYVPLMWEGQHKDFTPELYADKRYYDEGWRNCPDLGPNKDIVDEGVCVRVDGKQPFVLKLKSEKFYEHETKMLDEGVEDMEESQSDSGEENE